MNAIRISERRECLEYTKTFRAIIWILLQSFEELKRFLADFKIVISSWNIYPALDGLLALMKALCVS